MRKASFCSYAVLFSLVLVLLPATGVGQTPEEWKSRLERLRAYPDLIVVNGKISTMDARLTEVQAMAVRDNRIVALGSTDEIRVLAGPKTEVLDAKGRRVLPGLVDGHTHPTRFGVEHWLGEEGDFISKTYKNPQLKIVFAIGTDKLEVLRSLEQRARERAQELGPGKWIWVNLWAKDNMPDSRDVVDSLFIQSGGQPATITRGFLDSIAPNNPLLACSTEAIGPCQTNTRAKEEMIRIVGRELEGLRARGGIFYNILMQDRTQDLADFVKRELMSCIVPHGITAFSDHFEAMPSMMKIYRYLQERGELPARFAWWNELGAEIDEKYPFYYHNLGDLRGVGNDYIWNAGIGTESWEGGLTCTKAQLPSSDKAPGPVSASPRTWGVRQDCDQAKIDYAKQGGYWNALQAVKAGLRIGYLHGYSDGTYDALFDLIERAMAEKGLSVDDIRALRISLEHNPIVRPDQIPQIAKYGVFLGFNGYQVQGNIKGGAFLKTYGEKYMNWIAPMKSLVDAGARPVFNTDAHLHKSPHPWNIRMDYPPSWVGNYWAYMEFFATRYMRDDGITYDRREALDRTNLMKAATIWGAEQLLNEKNIGSLEVGKLADFLVIDKDYFNIPEDQIHTIQTLLTAVGGKVVFKAPNY